ncbi:hypothetical protein [Halosimplex marinum]|uniref:hypothetical protein n=1 Tax=Halosimplex marinum TaxID=3396620 RepID=UPI003F54FD45
MDSIELALQTENKQELINKLSKYNESYDILRSGMAYMTESGLDTLQDTVPSWFDDRTRKEWVVSISDGITSPAALRRLKNQNNSEVRVMMGEEALENFRFRTSPSFHPKFLWVNDDGKHNIFIGSHNLTRDALKVNWEVSVLLGGLEQPEDGDKIEYIEDYWMEVWDSADPCTSEFIETYDRKRENYLEDQSPKFIQNEGDSDRPIHKAKYLWTDIGAVSGGSQNQVDIPFYCSRYFSREPRTFDVGDKITVTLQYREKSSNDRSIQGNPKGMTRVNLPTNVKHISNLEDYYVAFEKIGEQEFKVILVPDTEEESGILGFLRHRCQELGTIGEANSGRVYGWL